MEIVVALGSMQQRLEWLAQGVVLVLAIMLLIAVVAVAFAGLVEVLIWVSQRLRRNEAARWIDRVAALELREVKSYADDPTDALIVHAARALRQDPQKVADTFVKAFMAIEYVQSIWPQIRAAINLDGPAEPTDPPVQESD